MTNAANFNFIAQQVSSAMKPLDKVKPVTPHGDIRDTLDEAYSLLAYVLELVGPEVKHD